MREFDIASPGRMENFGARLADCCPAGSKLYLQGDLGTGKTTLVRGFLRQLGYQGIVKSPTYTLVEPYQLNDLQVYHFDFYRIDAPQELLAIGIHDYFDDRATCLVEWPERGGKLLQAPCVYINISHEGAARRLSLQPGPAIDADIIARL